MLTFPGHGNPGESCGVTIPMFCHDCGEFFTVESSCMARECPNCYQAWAAREAAAAGQRLTAFLVAHWESQPWRKIEYNRWREAVGNPNSTKEECRLYELQTYHTVVSFDAVDLSGSNDVKAIRTKAYRIASSYGIMGGAAIVHRRGLDDPGTHVHIVGVAGYIRPGNGADGVVWKVIPHNGKWYARTQLERETIIKYALTHCVIADDLHALTWFGCLAYNKFSSKIVEYEIKAGFVDARDFERCCPNCGSSNVSKCFQMDYTAWPPVRVEITV